MDYKKIAKQIVETAGGNENIESVTHCMTRLRFVIRDKSKVDEEEIKNIEGVLGVIDATGQLQIVLGKNLIPIYSEVEKNFNLKIEEVSEETSEAKSVEEKEKFSIKGVFDNVIGFIGSSVTPMVPGLVSGGMMRVFLLLIVLIHPAFKDTSTYMMLYMISTAAFYFMPIYVAFGAAKKLGSTPIFAMIASAALVCPDFVGIVSKGETVTMLGVPVLLVKYGSTLLPAILIAYVAAKLEKLFNKIIPGIFKAVFVGVLTVAVSGTLGFLILGPAGTYLGNYIVNFLVFLQSTIGPFALAFLAGALPFLILTGIHHLFSPFMVHSLASVGYDGFFRPALILHNMAEGGACFGVALRTKNRDLRAEAFSSGIGCIFAGVTEPAIYGITVRLRKPLYGVMAGGAVGGLVAGLLGAKAYVMGYSSILAIPVFETTMIAIVVGIIISIAVSCIVTYILGVDDKMYSKEKQ